MEDRRKSLYFALDRGWVGLRAGMDVSEKEKIS